MYLATQFGLDAGSSAALSILPWAVNIACTNVGGWLGDKVQCRPMCLFTCAWAPHLHPPHLCHEIAAVFSVLLTVLRTCDGGIAEIHALCVLLQAIQEWGVDKTVVRKTMQGVASLGPAACLFVLAADQGAPVCWLAATCSAFSILFHQTIWHGQPF